MREFQLLSLHKPESLTGFHLNGPHNPSTYICVLNCAVPHFITDNIYNTYLDL